MGRDERTNACSEGLVESIDGELEEYIYGEYIMTIFKEASGTV